MEQKSKKVETNERWSSRIKQEIENFGSLGREIRVSPKSKVSVNKPGYGLEFSVETVDVLIGIGADHVAHLVMSKAAWGALKNGETLNIDTLKQFKKKFL